MTADSLLRTALVIERTDVCVRLRVDTPCRTCSAKCGFGQIAGQSIITVVDCENSPPLGSAVKLGVSRKGLTRVSAALFLPAISVFILVMALAENHVADSIIAGVGTGALLLALGVGALVSRRGVRLLDVAIV